MGNPVSAIRGWCVRNRWALVSSLAVACALHSTNGTARSAEPPQVRFEQGDGRLRITVGGEPFADYVYVDAEIPRPYFANVRAPGGLQATRHHPPRPGEDLMDHPTFHPGIWLAFGDLGGADSWRLKTRIDFAGMLAAPVGEPGQGWFGMRYSHRGQDPEETICTEEFSCEIRALEAGCLVIWDSKFTSQREFYYGDQEEMGLGLRVATPLRAQRQAEGDVPGGTGEILDAQDRRNERGVWGNAADWCDYSGVMDGHRVGLAIFCHPGNFRPSWFHARDRGLLTANPFGRAAFHKGERSTVTVRPGEELRLRYGILVHSMPVREPLDVGAVYRDFLDLAGD